ncbi:MULTISPECIES: hypothetical protein [Cytobacillus]|uniref:hypothetical protein n=1 Tax=Cytobacillus TaxID=2675230 RepID=UPI00203EFA0F|nr:MULTISPECIES: hypothetical protein [Cytobacillus]MCM3393716.1 hypothetical protein [Cytobacillus oceanisediminis]UQX54096.1 hypothetical protein M5V91_26245 [Cytobacillus pseudoceanisediminis]
MLLLLVAGELALKFSCFFYGICKIIKLFKENQGKYVKISFNKNINFAGGTMRLIFNGLFILIIFLLGFFFGKIDIEWLWSKVSGLSYIEIIGFGSSIVTLMLFLSYIIGRYYLIKRMEITLKESVEISYNNDNHNFNVIEEYTLGDLDSEIVYLSSSEPLRWIKFYEYNHNSKNYKGKLIGEHRVLRNGHALKINTYLTCGIPNYLIEYQRFDFIIGELILAEDGKNGNVSQNLSIKHTFKSILYYLIVK